MGDSDQPSAPSAAVPPEPVAAAPPQPPPATVGQMLRSARLAQGLTLEQLSTELRIEARQLNALEEEHFEQIGVPVFIKGYLKQYGLRLGLDFRDLLAQYYKQTTLADVQIQPSRTIKLRDDRQIASWIFAAVVLLAVIVGLAVWWWNGGSFTTAPSTPAPAAPQTTVEPAATAPPARSQPQEPPRSEAPPGALAAPPPAGETPPLPAAESAAARTAAATAPNVEPVDPNDDGRAEAVVAIPVELTFDEESSAEVTDGRGERLLSGLHAAGRRVTVRGEPPFAVVLGNADGVRLTVDGEPHAIPTVGREGSLVRFAVDVAEE